MSTNLFDRIDAPTSAVEMGAPAPSRVGELTGLGPSRTDALGQYPRPWYYTWDSPVWRVMAQDRTVVATCSDEVAAKQICEEFQL